ncbi:MAG TPA: plastocyanin/azurin family copper-binding protein [Chloroflexota bacterium]|nr:plastocyanin/azurin family copper-binding protein [Chloroflexota bacterium]
MKRGWTRSVKAASVFALSGSLLVGAAATAFAQAQTYNVRLTNFAIEGAPATVTAGATLRFNAVSFGFPHNLAIDGNGVDIRLNEPNLTDGQTGVFTMTAPAQAGTYNLYCTVGRHRDQGMVVPITVVAGVVALPRTGDAATVIASSEAAAAASNAPLPAGLGIVGAAVGASGMMLRRRRG